MPLQDIAYVLRVNDTDAKTKLASTAKSLEKIGKTEFSGMGARVSQAFAPLGGRLSALGGGFGLEGADIVAHLARTVLDAAPQLTDAFTTLGAAAFGALFDDALIAKAAGMAGFLGFGKGKKDKAGAAQGASAGPQAGPTNSAFNSLASKGMDATNTMIDFGRRTVAAFASVGPASVGLVKSVGAAFTAMPGKALNGLLAFRASVTSTFQAVGYGGMAMAQRMNGVFGALGSMAVQGGVNMAKLPLALLGGLTQIPGAVAGAFQSLPGLLSTAATAPIGSLGGVFMGLLGPLGLITAGLAAAAGALAFFGAKWGAVEESVMRIQAFAQSAGADLGKMGGVIQDKVLKAAEDMATGFGVAQKDTAEAIALMTKNGMSLDDAINRQVLLANISKTNGISMAEAARVYIGASNGELKALKEVGIRLTDHGSAAANAEAATAALAARYGDPRLSKPFVDDAPLARASAAVNGLWVQLGALFDDALTAKAAALADVIVGIADAFKEFVSVNQQDIIATFEGVYAAVAEVASVIGSVLRLIWNAGQMIWNGIMMAFGWVSEQVGTILAKIADGLAYVPGLGDSAKQLQEVAKSFQTFGEGTTKSAVKDFETNFNDMAAAVSMDPQDSLIEQAGARGRGAREKAVKSAQDKFAKRGKDEAGEKVKDEAKVEAEKAAKAQAEAQAKDAAKAQELMGERDKYSRQSTRVSITLNAPNRMIPSLRHAGRGRP